MMLQTETDPFLVKNPVTGLLTSSVPAYKATDTVFGVNSPLNAGLSPFNPKLEAPEPLVLDETSLPTDFTLDETSLPSGLTLEGLKPADKELTWKSPETLTLVKQTLDAFKGRDAGTSGVTKIGAGAGTAVGAGVGAIFGGPVGASLGASIGGAVGAIPGSILDWWAQVDADAVNRNDKFRLQQEYNHLKGMKMQAQNKTNRRQDTLDARADKAANAQKTNAIVQAAVLRLNQKNARKGLYHPVDNMKTNQAQQPTAGLF